jgi:hypothetical protein
MTDIFEAQSRPGKVITLQARKFPTHYEIAAYFLRSR